MIRSVTSFLAEQLVIDRDTNKVSAISVIDSLAGPGFPIFLGQIAFYSVFDRDATDPDNVQLDFSAELNGQILFSNQQPVVFGNELRARAYARISGFLIPAPGSLVFHLAHAGHQIADYGVNVTALTPQASQLSLIGGPSPATEPTGGGQATPIST